MEERDASRGKTARPVQTFACLLTYARKTWRDDRIQDYSESLTVDVVMDMMPMYKTMKRWCRSVGLDSNLI